MMKSNDNHKNVNRLAWRIEEIAKETGLSVQFLRKEIRNGNLKAQKKGRCVLVLDEEVRNYLTR
jgi:excisionase family DNA binding protein